MTKNVSSVFFLSSFSCHSLVPGVTLALTQCSLVLFLPLTAALPLHHLCPHHASSSISMSIALPLQSAFLPPCVPHLSPPCPFYISFFICSILLSPINLVITNNICLSYLSPSFISSLQSQLLPLKLCLYSPSTQCNEGLLSRERHMLHSLALFK